MQEAAFQPSIICTLGEFRGEYPDRGRGGGGHPLKLGREGKPLESGPVCQTLLPASSSKNVLQARDICTSSQLGENSSKAAPNLVVWHPWVAGLPLGTRTPPDPTCHPEGQLLAAAGKQPAQRTGAQARIKPHISTQHLEIAASTAGSTWKWSQSSAAFSSPALCSHSPGWRNPEPKRRMEKSAGKC